MNMLNMYIGFVMFLIGSLYLIFTGITLFYFTLNLRKKSKISILKKINLYAFSISKKSKSRIR